MIVCSCNAIREDELRRAARAGAPCAEAAYRALGCEFECGSCADYAQEIVEDERAAAASGRVLRFPKAA
ncbi:MAG TPA: (2Fe-2S)-binding protein [Sphingomicrobium sp.]|nr:(2Fe-2S)-binding protein [Sphingomicrobium sp.]